MAEQDGSEEFPVKLNVYDISQGMARQLSVAFLGVSIDAIYHTGVVVYGREYWFGAGIEQSSSPGRTYFGPPLQTLDLGRTAVPPELFAEFLSEIGAQFNAATYSLLKNNCNHFSDEVAQFLVGAGIPKHIVNLPDVVLNSPQGPLLANMLQGMENSLRSGQLGGAGVSSAFPNSFPTSPAGAPFAPTATRSPQVSTPAHAGGKATATTAPAAPSKEKTAAPAPSPASSAAPSAPKTLEEEIRQEFALLMALGTFGANEAAAEALRRVRDRRGGSVKAGVAS